ncbi:capsid protein [Ignavigranum ruoffiae]|uniref:capsid protein n=1 Tax=Ignavigranum ruoffiae TaxID=89093 RepID=UPI002356DDBF|nr:capsid protein [Ignavigranum ruoffiae]
MAIKLYTKEYVRTLPVITEVKNHFIRTFGGKLQIVDGIKESTKAFVFKVSDSSDVVLQPYSTDANVAFGTGTGKSSRFGERREIKSTDLEVDYDAPLAIHEGIDNFTVNDIPDQVIAERLEKHSEAWSEHLNEVLAKAISDNASKILSGEVVEVFNQANKEFVNNKINRSLAKVAYVSADVYNYLVDNKLTTTAKNSSNNIDTNTLEMFKGFVLEVIADEYFQEGENIYFAVDNAGLVGIGIQIVRTMDSEDFAGVALQGAGKYAKYIPEISKKGLLKANATTETVPSV